MYQNIIDTESGSLISQQHKTIVVSFTVLFTFLAVLSWFCGGA